MFNVYKRDVALLNKRGAVLHPELEVPSSFWMKPARAVVQRSRNSLFHPGTEIDPEEVIDHGVHMRDARGYDVMVCLLLTS